MKARADLVTRRFGDEKTLVKRSLCGQLGSMMESLLDGQLNVTISLMRAQCLQRAEGGKLHTVTSMLCAWCVDSLSYFG